jgi:hypothetical protein
VIVFVIVFVFLFCVCVCLYRLYLYNCLWSFLSLVFAVSLSLLRWMRHVCAVLFLSLVQRLKAPLEFKSRKMGESSSFTRPAQVFVGPFHFLGWDFRGRVKGVKSWGSDSG